MYNGGSTNMHQALACNGSRTQVKHITQHRPINIAPMQIVELEHSAEQFVMHFLYTGSN